MCVGACAPTTPYKNENVDLLPLDKAAKKFVHEIGTNRTLRRYIIISRKWGLRGMILIT